MGERSRRKQKREGGEMERKSKHSHILTHVHTHIPVKVAVPSKSSICGALPSLCRYRLQVEKVNTRTQKKVHHCLT